MPDHSKGQSILEYILFFAAVIVVLLVFLSPAGLFEKEIANSIDIAIEQIDLMVNNINFER